MESIDANKNERIIPITLVNKSVGNTKSPSTESDSNTKQQKLLVTHDDGSTSQIQGIVTNLSNNVNNNLVDNVDNKVTIQEIGQATFERETSKDRLLRKNVENTNVDQTKGSTESVKMKDKFKQTSDTKKGEKFTENVEKNPKKIEKNPPGQEKMKEFSPKTHFEHKKFEHKSPVRHVPIRLHDGKVIQKKQEEKVEVRSEYTNYSHEEIMSGPEKVEILTRMRPQPAKTADKKSHESHHKSEKSVTSSKTTNETVTSQENKRVTSPTTDSPKIEKSQKPVTSTKEDYGKSKTWNHATSPKERIIPIKLEDGKEIFPTFTSLEEPQPPKWSVFSKSNKNIGTKEMVIPVKLESNEDRGRRRTKSGDEPSKVESSRVSRSTDRKQHVRFKEENLESIRNESRESTTRRSMGRPTGKPPSVPSERNSYTSGIPFKKSGTSVHAGSPKKEVGGDQKTLLDIDRDITRIWKELQELDTAGQPPPRPITPVKVTSYTIPSAIQAERVSKTPPLSGSSQSSSGHPRTIWDTDPSLRDSRKPFEPSQTRQQGKVSTPKAPGTPILNGNGSKPFVTEPRTAPLATTESLGSPTKKVDFDKIDVAHKQTGIDEDDGIYEGIDFKSSKVGKTSKSPKRKSESPKRELKVDVPKPKSVDNISDCRNYDKSTQTGETDQDKRGKKNGHCSIA